MTKAGLWASQPTATRQLLDRRRITLRLGRHGSGREVEESGLSRGASWSARAMLGPSPNRRFPRPSQPMATRRSSEVTSTTMVPAPYGSGRGTVEPGPSRAPSWSAQVRRVSRNKAFPWSSPAMPPRLSGAAPTTMAILEQLGYSLCQESPQLQRGLSSLSGQRWRCSGQFAFEPDSQREHSSSATSPSRPLNP